MVQVPEGGLLLGLGFRPWGGPSRSVRRLPPFFRLNSAPRGTVGRICGGSRGGRLSGRFILIRNCNVAAIRA